MVKIKRKFFSVGQALFAIENVGDRVIAYDCGGQTKKLVSDAIWRWYHECPKREIDALFISHYDRDHINGVFMLLGLFRIKSVYLPMVSTLSRFMSATRSHFSLGYIGFYADPRAFLMNAGVRSVRYVGQQDTFLAEENATFEEGDNSDLTRNVVLSFPEMPDWVYIPYNRKMMEKQEEKDFFVSLGLPDDTSVLELLNLWEKKDLNLKKALLKIGTVTAQTINDYSMTLYSGSLHSQNGCLFLGDYNATANIAEIQAVYRRVWNNITMVQIPHHGSIHNFNVNLLISNAIHVISNKDKPYGKRQVDPSSVIREIEVNNKEICEKTFLGDVSYCQCSRQRCRR